MICPEVVIIQLREGSTPESDRAAFEFPVTRIEGSTFLLICGFHAQCQAMSSLGHSDILRTPGSNLKSNQNPSEGV